VDQNPETMKSCVSPYFSDLAPLAEKWWEIFRDRYGSRDAVDTDTLLEITETFLNNMPLEEPPEMTNVPDHAGGEESLTGSVAHTFRPCGQV